MSLTNRALLAMEVDYWSSIRPLLELCGLDLAVASSCREAALCLKQDRALRIVFSGVTFPDGDWLRLLHETLSIRPRAALVVCSDSELNNRHLPPHVFAYGAHGLLVTPYDESQVRATLKAIHQTRKGELKWRSRNTAQSATAWWPPSIGRRGSTGGTRSERSMPDA